ncbi:MAG TPA: hypothetical protein VGK17_22520 [Propionicimonas sp.]|jgi:hypothetical protein
MLARFRALDAQEQSERDARDAVLRAALDAICELQVAWALSAARTAPRDALVAAWTADRLDVELTPGEPIPTAIRGAFRRSQEALWGGEPVGDALALLGDDLADQPPAHIEQLADWP